MGKGSNGMRESESSDCNSKELWREWRLLASVQTPVQIRARQKAATGRSYLGKKTKAERLMLSSGTVILKPSKTQHPISWVFSLPSRSTLPCSVPWEISEWQPILVRFSLVFPFGEVPAQNQGQRRERWEIYSFGSLPSTQGLTVTGFLMEPTALSISYFHRGNSHPVLAAGPSLCPFRRQAVRVELHAESLTASPSFTGSPSPAQLCNVLSLGETVISCWILMGNYPFKNR